MDGPFLMRGRVTGQHGDTPMPIGLVRPFKARTLRSHRHPHTSHNRATHMHLHVRMGLNEGSPFAVHTDFAGCHGPAGSNLLCNKSCNLIKCLILPRCGGCSAARDYSPQRRPEGLGMRISMALQVLAIPEDMEFYGRGPLLAAKELDLDVLWSRARQMQAACEQVLGLCSAPAEGSRA